MFTAAQAA